MFGFWEVQDDLPPPPASSSVFVMRNGRYEPQNLMPVLPRPDVLDFDGFVMRRGTSAGYRHARPPEMRQAALVKNPVSIRRDSARATEVCRGGVHDTDRVASPGEATVAPQMHSDVKAAESEGGWLTLSFTFDAAKPGVLSVHLFTREVERCSALPGGGSATTIDLCPQWPDGEAGEERAEAPQGGMAPLALAPQRFEAGLGQAYESPPLDLARRPVEALAFDPERPRDIPVAVRLEVDALPGGEVCVHHSYLSLHRAALRPEAGPRRQQWSVQVYAQKLQYGGQSFVLHEVFGVSSKSLDMELDCGSSDCVICLSAPRDTAVLPCRHMCFCSYCAGIVRLQCDRCPVCRQKVVSLLQFKREGLTAGRLDPAGSGVCTAASPVEAAASTSALPLAGLSSGPAAPASGASPA